MDEYDVRFLRDSFIVARSARNNGNHPFGALLVDDDGHLLMEAENTVVTTGDCTGHAETNLVRMASAKYGPEFLARCTIYASTEPCPMCTGAIYWANIGRVVFGLSQDNFYAKVGGEFTETLLLSCREVLARGKKPIVVIGPLLEDDARQVHLGFWN